MQLLYFREDGQFSCIIVKLANITYQLLIKPIFTHPLGRSEKLILLPPHGWPFTYLLDNTIRSMLLLLKLTGKVMNKFCYCYLVAGPFPNLLLLLVPIHPLYSAI